MSARIVLAVHCDVKQRQIARTETAVRSSSPALPVGRPRSMTGQSGLISFTAAIEPTWLRPSNEKRLGDAIWTHPIHGDTDESTDPCLSRCGCWNSPGSSLRGGSFERSFELEKIALPERVLVGKNH